MTQTVLIQAYPADPATGGAVPVRLAGGGSRAFSQLGFGDWRAGVATLPRFTAEIGYDANGWNGNAIPQVAGTRFNSADQQLTADLAGLYWRDARITITTGDDETGVYATAFVGSVGSVAIEGGVLSFALADLSVDLNKPLLLDTFAGTGGLEGPVDIAGRVKRRSWGRVFNVEGMILDKANNIYEFGDPARQIAGFVRIKDKGREGPFVVLDWQGSIAATFAALQVAVAPDGGGVVAPSISCAKWWTVAVGPLTADLFGEVGAAYVETVPAMVERVAGTIANPVPVAQVADFATLRPEPAGVHVDSSSETVAQVLDRLCLGVSLLWLMSATGSIQFRQWRWTSTGSARAWTPGEAIATAWQPATAIASRWSPLVVSPVFRSIGDINRREVFAPVKSRKLGYQRNYRIHTDAEISAAIQADDVFYPDGDTVAAFKPATAGADNTAASETGQIVADALNPDGTVKAGKVGTDSISQSAVQQTKVQILTSDQGIAQGAIATVASVTLNKDEDDSLLKVTFSGMFWSGDDLQFNCSVLVDGVMSYSCGQQNIVLVASGAKATLSPFVYLTLPAGRHTIGFNVANVEDDNVVLTVKAGSALEVLEIKQGAT